MKLTRKNFEAWLKGKRPRQIVGRSMASTYCPLANFTGKSVHVGMAGQCVLRDKLKQSALGPKWAAKFIRAVDHSPYRQITASRALKILEGIK